MKQMSSRKRPAPGASPLVQQETVNGDSTPPQIPNSQSPQWPPPPNGLPSYPEPTGNTTPYYNNGTAMAMSAVEAPQLHNQQLVRRPPNTQIAPISNYGDAINGAYDVATEDSQYTRPAQNDDLEQRALYAQRDAQSKRKQIPPFVQKLSSFLDESRNTDLIRWSDSGDSFIVVDEDEFAKTLIPELFKHNNYASFVRQLNMYGFHKKVGLSDNSMRASERKNKNPSEYSNPYFKRARPTLLWLIHKPKNAQAKGSGKGGGRARQEDVEEDADDYISRDSPAPPNHEPLENGPGTRNGIQYLTLGNNGNGAPQDQLASVQQELQEIRLNQRRITEMLNLTRREHQQLYGQAKAFHELHEKHDNSINAILTFLATVYNKNLPRGGLDMNNMFDAIPQNNSGQGNIVDMGDYKSPEAVDDQSQQIFRRPPLLLENGGASTPTSAKKTKVPKPKTCFTGDNQDFYNYPTKQPLHSPAIQELSDRTPSNRSSQSPQIQPDTSRDKQIPEADIMSMINSANAQNNENFPGARMEFPEALSHLQNTNGQSPLTPNQRQDMLQLMAKENGNLPQNGSNALASYSSTNSADNLARFDLTREHLDQISRSLREQEQHLANVQGTLAPLSPSGSIPGVSDQVYDPQNGQDMLDMDTIFNCNDYFNNGTNPDEYDFSNNTEFPDFDFSMTPSNGETRGGTFDANSDEGRVVETMDSSEATSPANTVDDGGGGQEHGDVSPRKLRKRG